MINRCIRMWNTHSYASIFLMYIKITTFFGYCLLFILKFLFILQLSNEARYQYDLFNNKEELL